ncbi:hypothetical protein M595_2759 [Lyngbya aestuarii BL J]|uniref:Uncharacterized protein n=1 Tax=Lyngbya aestuarii BL J TaxID=1348334 RepID=U7QH35_9CYAN|nr:hypothetical protein [Lyngbya aestuarii]ERT03855.1 hypothetical protein M595_6204 [Lyngbya aestuarii BL J]ERT06237.1 hypothetical protein M595_3854 [Lyngbya aestuarii BL J]ERT07208.1 hypothetical protein M595_2759 [Lyngbya aestuarii BL J]
MTLSELKAQAQALGLSKYFISQHGDLRKKSTWQAAVNACEVSESLEEQETEETVSDDLFEPLVEPEIINITPESHPETWELLQPPIEPGKLINKSVDGDYWVVIGDWVKLDEAHTCQVTHVLAENDVEIQIEESGKILNVTPDRIRHLTEAELDEVEAPEFMIATQPETPTTYQVITDNPEIPSRVFTPKSFLHYKKPEESLHKRTPPKLPLQDFFAALFSPPNHYQTSQ